MKYDFRNLQWLLGALAAVGVAACGGHSVSLTEGDAAGTLGSFEDARCGPEHCPPGAAWSQTTCSCVEVSGNGVDAMAGCAMPCPSGSVLTQEGSSCFCLLEPNDAEAPDSTALDAMAPHDAGIRDATTDAPDAATQGSDGASEAPDGSQYTDVIEVVEDAQCYFGYSCGPGYALSATCTCEPCAATCPNGQTPGPGCNGCVACSQTCPTGFDDGPSCSCIPHGTDAGPAPPPDAGVTCLLEGYRSCSANSWCELGVCQDGQTQYGCFCNADGTATCNLTCPVPAPCTIPGQATACPPGRECVYGSCSDPSAELLVCQCSTYGDGGNAYCYTASCADGAAYIPDAGTGDVTCLLQGYTACSAGSWCALGSCPDGTEYGCLCNADGTATCDVTCPPPPSCNIPGEGTCPYGSSCLFGCSGGAGIGLSCYCESGGTASCSTVSCSAAGHPG